MLIKSRQRPYTAFARNWISKLKFEIDSIYNFSNNLDSYLFKIIIADALINLLLFVVLSVIMILINIFYRRKYNY
jgi:hypothetical protein